MGFCYGYNPLTGRQVLACDICGHTGGCRKLRCPYGYCQAWAVCRKPQCRAKARGTSSVGVVNADGTPNDAARAKHAHCKQAKDRMERGEQPRFYLSKGDGSPARPLDEALREARA